MFQKTIFTGLSPNVERDDVWRSLRLMFTPWNWKRGKAISKLEKIFQDVVGVPRAVSFISGRTSLFAILKAMGIQKGDEVILQAYTCVAVPEAVLWCKARPVYVDIDPQTLNMDLHDLEKKITSRSKALIIQHTFGNPAYMDALFLIARKHNLFVIEDCAHALGATYKGAPLGSFGDASFFSFGRDKVISGVFGGMALTRDHALAQKLSETQQSWGYPGFLWIKQQLLYAPIISCIKHTYDFFSLGKILFYFVKKFHILSQAVYPEERRGVMPFFVPKRMPNALAQLVLGQYKKLNTFNAHRKQIAALYAEKCSSHAIDFQKIQAGGDSIFLRFTVLDLQAPRIMEVLKKQSILLGDWYQCAVAPNDTDLESIQYSRGSCPEAERAAKLSVNLPTDIHIKKKDAEKIMDMITNMYGDAHH